MKPIIRVENLSKQYRIRERQKPYSMLRESIADAVRSPLKTLKRNDNKDKDHFWALRDVSFEVKPGEVLGIIGRNGAGKSTLLKILSRITDPTRGRIELYGRVGSLIEVGTGFHPELTGRENIFLNGAILGMRREEIAKKFDEIVDFAEIEEFLDLPVKHYSSGMYMRLGFAVAAHLEPEILMIDEVLSVGDMKFQRKCLGKLEEVGKEGRTVLFVSHNLAVVRQLCKKAILLENGCFNSQGKVSDVLATYLDKQEELSKTKKFTSQNGIVLIDIHFRDTETNTVTNSLVFNQSYQLNIRLQTAESLNSTVIVLQIYDELGNRISSICSLEEAVDPFIFEGMIDVSFFLPKLQLFPGSYTVSLIVGTIEEAFFNEDRCFNFEIIPNIVNDAAWAYNQGHGITRVSAKCEISSVVNKH